jgi:hypothetical protein
MLTMREVVGMVREWSPHKVTKTFLPISFMTAIQPLVGFAAKLQGKEPAFTKEMIIAAISHKKILYDKAKKDLGFTVRDLRGTFREMLDWYQARDLLR